MKPLRFLLLSLTVVSASLVPQVPSQASELVKLGRLLVTGKRASAVPVVPPTVVSDEGKPGATPAARPSADTAERTSAAPRAPEVVQEAREGTGAAAASTDRPTAMEPKALDRGSVGGGSVLSSGERSSWFSFSLRSWLRGV